MGHWLAIPRPLPQPHIRESPIRISTQTLFAVEFGKLVNIVNRRRITYTPSVSFNERRRAKELRCWIVLRRIVRSHVLTSLSTGEKNTHKHRPTHKSRITYYSLLLYRINLITFNETQMREFWKLYWGRPLCDAQYMRHSRNIVPHGHDAGRTDARLFVDFVHHMMPGHRRVLSVRTIRCNSYLAIYPYITFTTTKKCTSSACDTLQCVRIAANVLSLCVPFGYLRANRMRARASARRWAPLAKCAARSRGTAAGRKPSSPAFMLYYIKV